MSATDVSRRRLILIDYAKTRWPDTFSTDDVVRDVPSRWSRTTALYDLKWLASNDMLELVRKGRAGKSWLFRHSPIINPLETVMVPEDASSNE